MRKSYYAIPFLAAGAVAGGLASAALASASPILIAPIPTEYPWCELDLYCYDDDISIALNPRRDDVGYGGGAAFGSGDDDE
ncbi:hypothetical protein [Mycolicibacterium iranicum]|uniref:Porin n=1 Tax=Mycolicibacterium iranicum TaxID=912594 RepID=A0A178LUS9_MYCIR|nr:hypothetical protein [Mycolicibacterium iranicum]OAN37977.1 hypothetical protein A4X20_20465 [Mycolicibacterium iranicum]